ncbi:MAG: hypothetical protein IT285_15075 [Bdellovibrionales bacterium]|nr:hypothetical protein [Bdellovibrionales bacterium]
MISIRRRRFSALLFVVCSVFVTEGVADGEEVPRGIPGLSNVPVEASCRGARTLVRSALQREARYLQRCQPSRYLPTSESDTRPPVTELGDVVSCADTPDDPPAAFDRVGRICSPVCQSRAPHSHARALMSMGTYPNLIQANFRPTWIGGQGVTEPQACMLVAPYPLEAMPDIRVVTDRARFTAGDSAQRAYWTPQKRAWRDAATATGGVRPRLVAIQTRLRRLVNMSPRHPNLDGPGNVRRRSHLNQSLRAVDNLLMQLERVRTSIEKETSPDYTLALEQFRAHFSNHDESLNPTIQCPGMNAVTLRNPDSRVAFCCPYTFTDAPLPDGDAPPPGSGCVRPEGATDTSVSPEDNARLVIADRAGMETGDAAGPNARIFTELNTALGELMAPGGPMETHEEEFHRLAMLWECREYNREARYYWREASERCSEGSAGPTRACRLVLNGRPEPDPIERLRAALENAIEEPLHVADEGSDYDYQCLPHGSRFTGDEVDYREVPPVDSPGPVESPSEIAD